MMPDNQDQRDDGSLRAPPKLAAALGQLPRQRLFIPPTVDEAVLRAAQRHLGKRQKQRTNWRCLMKWLVPAGACLLLGLLAAPWAVSHVTTSHVAKFDREDLNRDGRVDILDAFALARQLKAGGPVAAADLNGDGKVDQRDVSALAARAVTLTMRGSR